jgi:phosphoribosylformylglycinamidine synthase
MNPVEVMTSESQERMLAIVTPANLDACLDLCVRWEIRATVIGRVTDTARFRVYDGLFDAGRCARSEPARTARRHRARSFV